MDEIYERADAFLFGRRTYDVFAATWGSWDDPGDSPIWTALHARPKYLVSSSPVARDWATTTVLSGDIAAAIRELTAKPGRELQVHGSGALTRWLLDSGLVDEMNLFIFPVVVGQGTRLFPDTGPDRALDLVDSSSARRGSRSRATGWPDGRDTDRPIPTRTREGEWSRHSDLNRGPAVYELDRPKRCGTSVESASVGRSVRRSSIWAWQGVLLVSVDGPAAERR